MSNFVEYMDADSAKAPRWALFRHQFSLRRAEDGKPYLGRWWLIKTPLGGLALHKIEGPDARFDLHDHPWNFTSIILRGGYTEQRLDPKTRRRYVHHVRRINRLRTHDAHYIHDVDRNPTWTLLLISRKRRKWGFWTENVGTKTWTWTPHDEFDSGHYAGVTM